MPAMMTGGAVVAITVTALRPVLRIDQFRSDPGRRIERVGETGIVGLLHDLIDFAPQLGQLSGILGILREVGELVRVSGFPGSGSIP